MSKISKNCFCLVLATRLRVDPVACPSCEPTQKFFVTHWWVNVPITKNTYNIFQNLSFYCFSRLSLVTCSWVEVPIARVLKDFRNLPRDSFTGRISTRKKHLENFFQIFFSKVFSGLPWRLARDLTQSQKTCVLHFNVSF